MNTSLEIRWFCQGDVPAGVRSWFHSIVPKAAQEPPRTDIYLLSSTADLGIKYRQSRFEVKKHLAMSDSLPRCDLPDAVEHWTKWSFPLVPDDPTMPLLNDPTHWIAVRKSRTILRYQYVPGVPLIPLSPGKIPIQGGALELTQVYVNDQPWWTVGVETHGPLNAQVSCFTQLFDQLFTATGTPDLSAICPCSYPQWLLNMQQHG